MNVTVGSVETVVDAGGDPVDAVNVTLRAGSDWATHWVDPISKRVVVVSAPRAELGTMWDWSASGEEAFFGHGDALMGVASWPERIEVPCCPASKSIKKHVQTEDLTLELTQASSNGSLKVLGDANESWAPPSSRNVSMYTWNGHHPPEGEYPTSFPIERALRVAEEEDETVQAYMEQHPRWQIYAALAIQNPGSTPSYEMNDAEGEGRWGFEITAPDTTNRLAVDVIEEALLPEEWDENRATAQHWVDSELRDEGDPLAWIPPRSIDLMGMTEAWRTVDTVVEPSRVPWRVVFQYDTTAGPLWISGLHHDSDEYDEETGLYQLQETLIDLETGLLVQYTGYRDLVDVIKRPLPR